MSRPFVLLKKLFLIVVLGGFSCFSLANTPPVVTSTPQLSVLENADYLYRLAASDVDNDDLTWALDESSNLPEGINLYHGFVSTLFSGLPLNSPAGITLDAQGNVYIADSANHRIIKVLANGSATVLAGSGIAGNQNGSGSAASFNSPSDLALDSDGNVFVVDTQNSLIRKIDNSGAVTTFVSSGLYQPSSLTIDSDNNLYIADTGNHRIRKVTPDGTLTTVAGSGFPSGVDGQGAGATFNQPFGIALDDDGNLYVADTGNNKIRKIDDLGNVTTFAGNGQRSDIDGLANQASFSSPANIIVDGDYVYVADFGNHKIRKISASGEVSTLAGTGDVGLTNGEATQATFQAPRGLALDAQGDLIIADTFNHTIRKLMPEWLLSGQPSVGGQYDIALTVSDGSSSVNHDFQLTVLSDNDAPTDLLLSATHINENVAIGTTVGSLSAVDEEGDVLEYAFCGGVDDADFAIVNQGGEQNDEVVLTTNSLIDFENKSQYQICLQVSDANDSALSFQKSFIIYVDNINEFTPEITSTALSSVLENSDYQYFLAATDADGDSLTWSLSPSMPLPTGVELYQGKVTTFTDYGQFSTPSGVAIDANGNVYVADSDNHRIIKIAEDGTVSTFAGTGNEGSSNASGDPLAASFNYPTDVAIDSDGNLYIADFLNHVIRKVSAAGEITTLAGSGSLGSADGQGTGASFFRPNGIDVDSSGNVYVADTYNHKVRKIDSLGNVTTLAGSGLSGELDGQGSAASFNYPFDLAVSANGTVYLADSFNHKIRKITSDGSVSTIAGSGTAGSDDGRGLEASFDIPFGIAVDDSGNVYVTDVNNHKIRKIDSYNQVTSLTGQNVSVESVSAGLVNGQLADAQFNELRSIVVTEAGQLLVADSANNAVRHIDTSWQLSGQAENYGDYPISLQVSDGDNNATESFVLQVSSDNDAPTDVVLTSYDIDENVTSATVVGELSALDEENDNFSFTFCSGDNSGQDNDAFIISNQAGSYQLLTNTAIDYETKASYSLCIQATDTDDSGSFLAKNITISVNNVNEFEPTTSPSTVEAELDENSFYQYLLSATDGDNQVLTWASSALPQGLSLLNGLVATFEQNLALNAPIGIAQDSSGNFYVADSENHRIVKITASGDASIYAGTGFEGSDDGARLSASFKAPRGIAVDSEGNVYVADSSNHKIRKIAADGTVTTLAGSGDNDDLDGQASSAAFSNPSGIAVDSAGNVYVADTYNHKIKLIAVDGTVSIYAGSGVNGDIDGESGDAAFSYPFGLALSSDGLVVVADTFNNKIRQIDETGKVTTLAGSGEAGAVDGSASVASFNAPYSVVLDDSGQVYVADANNHLIRKVDLLGQVSTLAGNGTTGLVNGEMSSAVFTSPRGLVVTDSGDIFVSDTVNNTIRQIQPAWQLVGEIDIPGDYTIDLTVSDGEFSDSQTVSLTVNSTNDDPTDIQLSNALIDENIAQGSQVGRLLTIDEENDSFSYAFCNGVDDGSFALSTSGDDTYLVTNSAIDYETKAGYQVCITGTDINQVGVSISKTLAIYVNNLAENEHAPQVTSTPVSIAVEDQLYQYQLTATDADGNYLTWSVDPSSSLPNGLSLIQGKQVTTVAGSGIAGSNDGIGSEASFYDPIGIAIDHSGNIFLADSENNLIRKIDQNGQVSTFAGSGVAGDEDGQGELASFSYPSGVAVDGLGNVYVADRNNHKIRKIDASGNVTTLAGSGLIGSLDGAGTSASFAFPTDIAIDNSLTLYISDRNNHKIRKIDAAGQVTTFAGSGDSDTVDGQGKNAAFAFPFALTVDSSGNVYVSSTQNRHIRKIDTLANVSTFVTGSDDGGDSTTSFNTPYGLTIDSQGNLYLADTLNHVIRKVTPTGEVSLYAGVIGQLGDVDGDSSQALFDLPINLVIDGEDNLYVVDSNNHKVRKITTTWQLSGELTLDGNYPISLIVSDGDNDVTHAFNIDVTATNDLPELVQNSPLMVAENDAVNISASVLTTSDEDNSNDELVYTITTLAQAGQLYLDSNDNGLLDQGEQLVEGDSFSQADIDSGLVYYQQDGTEQLSDKFEFSVADNLYYIDAPISGQWFNFVISPVNDVAVISGELEKTITEQQASISGSLSVTDGDGADQESFITQQGATDDAGFGAFSLSSDGSWSYLLNYLSPAVQALPAASQVTESFTISSVDGTAETVEITVTGVNDTAVITGTTNASVSEDALVAITGQLQVSDIDSGEALFNGQTNQSSVQGYGVYSISENGLWSYQLDANNTTVQRLVDAQSLTDSFIVSSLDNTTKTVSITIEGADGAAVIAGIDNGAISEDQNSIISGVLTLVDEDAGQSAFAPLTNVSSANGYGTFNLASDGSWSYQLSADNSDVQALLTGQSLTDSFVITAVDGTSHTVTVTINGQNGAAVISGTNSASLSEDQLTPVTGQLTVTDEDFAQAQFISQQGVNSDNGYGVFSISTQGLWSYSLDTELSQVQALTAASSLTDSFVVSSVDGTEETITLTITGVNDAALITGNNSASLTEDDFSPISGVLAIVDVDENEASFVSQTTTHNNGYGQFSIDTSGNWQYQLDSLNSDVQALLTGQNLIETFTAQAIDGTEHIITITITGVNGVSTIIGSLSGLLNEDELNAISGALSIVNEDNGDASFIAQAISESDNGYGRYTLATDGDWHYQLIAEHQDVQALIEGQQLSDSFTVSSAQGTTAVVEITITGLNDTAIISGSENGEISEDASSDISGQLTVEDKDLDQALFIEQSAVSNQDGFGLFNLSADGFWRYTLISSEQVQALLPNQVLTDSFVVSSVDGTTKTITITITGENGQALITGTSNGLLSEDGSLLASGTLTVTDEDSGQAFFVSQAAVRNANGLGSFSIDADGAWQYVLDNSNTEVQALAEGDTVTESFAVTSLDGTEHFVSISIVGKNGAANIAGTSSGSLTEDDNTQISGQLTVSDEDSGEALFFAQTSVATATGYGFYSISEDGTWSYQLASNNSAVQALAENESLTDSFTVSSLDGSSQNIEISILGVNGQASISGSQGGSVSEDADSQLDGQLTILDEDNDEAEFIAQSQVTNSQNYGEFNLTSAGYWTYVINQNNSQIQSLVNGESLTDSFEISSLDGTTSLITIVITGENGVATISGSSTGAIEEDQTTAITGKLNVVDEDANQALFNEESQVLSNQGYGLFSIDSDGNWHYQLIETNDAVQALVQDELLTDSFTVTTIDGTSQTVEISITGTNGQALISGTNSASLSEDATAAITGQLTIVDEDAGEALFIEQTSTTNTGAYGQFSINAQGFWSYQIDSENSEVQALTAGESLMETFAVMSLDGTSHTVTITITGENGAATITGNTSGALTEDDSQAITGKLTVSDEDIGEAQFTTQASSTNSDGYGSFSIDADGNWSYLLDSGNTDVQGLTSGQELTESFVVLTADNTSEQITITITGIDGVATITGSVSATITEDETGQISGKLAIVNEDSADSAFVEQIYQASVNGYGVYSIDEAGNWYYLLSSNDTVQALVNEDDTLTDSFEVSTLAGTAQTIEITISGVNSPATISGTTQGTIAEDQTTSLTANLTVSDEDSGEAQFISQSASQTLSAYGAFSISANGAWSYELDNSNNAVQALAVGDTLTESFVVKTIDGSSQTVTVVITGENGVANLSGSLTASVSEDDNDAVSGQLSISDEDSGQAKFKTQHQQQSDYGFGEISLDQQGAWTYQLDNTQTQVQALTDASDVLSDSFTVESVDGTSAVITITITGVNDQAIITGTSSAALVEDQITSVNGQLLISDQDRDQAAFLPQSNMSNNGGYGAFSVDVNGLWNYQLDNDNLSVQALVEGDNPLTESFMVSSVDGTTENISISISGINGQAVISGTNSGQLTSGTSTPANGQLSVSDEDSGQAAFTVQTNAVGSYGSFTVNAQGTWSYQASSDNQALISLAVGEELNERFTVTSIDGTSEEISITLVGVNDAPTISGSPSLTVNENQFYSFTPIANDADNNDQLTFAITNKPDWASFDINSGQLTGTPDETQAGIYAGIEIRVTDTIETISLPEFSVEVLNDPQGDSDGDGVADVDDAFPNDPTRSEVALGDNKAPSLSFTVSQNQSPVSVIDSQAGTVTVTVNVLDENSDDQHQLFWDVDTSPIVDLDNDNLATTFEFSPQLLSSGSYGLTLIATETNTSNLYSVSAKLLLVVDNNFAALTDIDTDNDGISDIDEGYGDSDHDGIADYLDSDADTSRLPLDSTNSRFIQTEQGLQLSLGDVIRVANGVTSTTAATFVEDISDHGGENGNPVINASDDQYDHLSAIVSFNVSGIVKAGDSASVVIPLAAGETIPVNALYRKYVSTKGWFNFVEDNANQLASATKDNQGNCPAPNSSAYSAGLNAGDECIELTIEDGGDNDADGLANGIIEDPGVLATLFVNNAPVISLVDSLTVDEQTAVSLDASASFDLDNDPLTFSWQQTSGVSVSLTGTTSNTLSFTAPSVSSEQTLSFELTVFDGTDSVTKLVSVVVKPVNNEPVISLVDSLAVDEQTAVTLDASASFDLDNDPLTFSWLQTSGASVSLTGTTSNTLSFTAPSVSSDQTLSFELTVFDGTDSATKLVTVVVENVPVVVEPEPEPPTTPTKKKSSGGSIYSLFLLLAVVLSVRKLVLKNY